MKCPRYIGQICLIWLFFLPVDNARGQVPLPDAVTIFDGTTLTQTVTVSAQEINLLSISGNVTLTIDSATAGVSPDPATDTSTSFSLTVNSSDKKLSAALDADFPTGISLSVTLTAPTGASAAQQTLSAVAQDVVTGVGNVTGSALTIAYEGTASAQVAPNGGGVSRTVTFTLADG